MIRPRMVKVCDHSICKHLKLIFQSSLESLPVNGKKRMWFQFIKKVVIDRNDRILESFTENELDIS